MSAVQASLQRWEILDHVSLKKNVGMQKETVDYIIEEMKLLKIQIALQKGERAVRLVDAAQRASYAGEVSACHDYVFVLAGVGDA